MEKYDYIAIQPGFLKKKLFLKYMDGIHFS